LILFFIKTYQDFFNEIREKKLSINVN